MTTTTITFCLLVRFICFLLAIFLLIACFKPSWAAKVRLLEAILATALVAWLCIWI